MEITRAEATVRLVRRRLAKTAKMPGLGLKGRRRLMAPKLRPTRVDWKEPVRIPVTPGTAAEQIGRARGPRSQTLSFHPRAFKIVLDCFPRSTAIFVNTLLGFIARIFGDCMYQSRLCTTLRRWEVRVWCEGLGLGSSGTAFGAVRFHRKQGKTTQCFPKNI